MDAPVQELGSRAGVSQAQTLAPAVADALRRVVESERQHLDPVVIRTLHPAEFAMLAPHLTQGPPHPDHSVVVVAQRMNSETGLPGRLAAFAVIWDTVHIEPFWVAPEYRQRPGLLRRIWSAVEQVLRRSNVPLAFSLLEPGSLAEAPLSRMKGWTELPGKLWRFVTPAAGEGAFKR